MALLKRDDILNASDLTREDVDVPEWGGTVRVRSMTGAERDRYEQSMMRQNGKSQQMNLVNARARMVAMCTIGEDGTRLFADRDVEVLGEKSAAALDRVFTVARRLSGFSEDDIEELTKNSDDVPSDAFTSD